LSAGITFQPPVTFIMSQSKREQLIGILFVLAAIFSWGAYFPFAKIILKKVSPEVFLFFRLGIGGLILSLLSLKSRQKFAVDKRELLPVVIAGTVGIILHQLVQVAGLKLTTATNTGWILTLIPPITGLLGWIFLKERVSWRQILGLTVAIIGVLLFVSKGNLSHLSATGHLGDLLALFSVGTWSGYTILMKPLLKKHQPLFLSTFHMGLGFIFFLFLSARTIPSQIIRLSGTDWLILILIGIIPSGLAYFWWSAGLQRLSAINTSTFLFVEAIVASFTAFLVLHESFTLPMLLFAAVIISGVYITQSSKLRINSLG